MKSLYRTEEAGHLAPTIELALSTPAYPRQGQRQLVADTIAVARAQGLQVPQFGAVRFVVGRRDLPLAAAVVMRWGWDLFIAQHAAADDLRAALLFELFIVDEHLSASPASSPANVQKRAEAFVRTQLDDRRGG